MREKEKRIEQLEKELFESRQRVAHQLKSIAEGNNFEIQFGWKAWQIVLLPIAIVVIFGLISVMIVLAKSRVPEPVVYAQETPVTFMVEENLTFDLL